MLIWGLVAAKAKTGLGASESKDASTVGAALKKAGSLIMLIVLATVMNVYGTSANAEAPLALAKLAGQPTVTTNVKQALRLTHSL